MKERNSNLNSPLDLEECKRFFDLLPEICVYMSSILEIDKLLAFTVNKLAEVFRVNKVSFMLFDGGTEELILKAAQGLDLASVQVRLKLGESFSGRVAQEGNPLLVKDIETEYPQFSKDRLSRYTTKSFVIMPVKLRGELIGVLNLTDKKDGSIFANDDLKMLSFITGYLALDIENIRLSEKNNSLSNLDPLTDLFNHRYFHEQLLEEIYRAERYRRPLSLAMLDIDNFAYYNEAYGHAAGDTVLKQIGRMIKENTRQADTVSRYGGEEFMVILPETRLKDAIFVGEKIRESIAGAIFTDGNGRKSSLGMSRLTVSVGVAEHRVGLAKEELMRRVVSALLEAKQKGKNRVCVFK